MSHTPEFQTLKRLRDQLIFLGLSLEGMDEMMNPFLRNDGAKEGMLGVIDGMVAEIERALGEVCEEA